MQTIAVVPQGCTPDFALFSQIVHAIQVQVTNDLFPAWGVQAAIGAYPSIAAAPPKSAIIWVALDAKGRGGMHFAPLLPNEAPHAVVTYTDNETWSIALSHEVIEMLVDPAGNYLLSGPDPEDPGKTAHFLVEVCDPCTDISYPVDEAGGIHVSDFCLPAFYDRTLGGDLTFCKSINARFTVASGGYLTWKTNENKWRQCDATGGPCEFVDIADADIQAALTSGNLRGSFDRRHGQYGGPTLGARGAKSRLALIRKNRAELDLRHGAHRKAMQEALRNLGI